MPYDNIQQAKEEAGWLFKKRDVGFVTGVRHRLISPQAQLVLLAFDNCVRQYAYFQREAWTLGHAKSRGFVAQERYFEMLRKRDHMAEKAIQRLRQLQCLAKVKRKR
jgi:hypothetical protein